MNTDTWDFISYFGGSFLGKPPMRRAATSPLTILTILYLINICRAEVQQQQRVSASSTSTFHASPLKHRRTSLALPSSPKLVPAFSFRDDTGLESHVAETCLVPEKRGKLRKISASPENDDWPQATEKKLRKKWSAEETQMLVDGCNKHGVGNWKAILSDPDLKFDNRSPVDLKDRFRTYFPDAYKQHYPNARTHLSSKVRSTLPDGSSLFEKTRSKKRRPFTEEEDRALKAGYEKHGTVWATIVKDPVFQEQGRRSTDLRDRFRNAFPELYMAAGYKPRNAAKKKGADGTKVLIRAATDDQLSMSTSGPSTHRRKRRNTSQGLLRGGTKSVPQSTAPSEDEASSAAPTVPSANILPDDDDMELIPFDPLPDSLTALANSSQSEIDSQSQAWSSGLDTPVHSSHHAWTGSPTSSQMSDYLLSSSHSSPFQHRRNEAVVGGIGMIGKSAWGTQDWFSANPRMDSSASGTSSSSYLENSFSPSSPFSFNHLNYGVVDRYDLVPTSFSQDFNSEVGSSSFSDEVYPPRREYHSDYAGDLIFSTRTQSQSSYDSSSFTFGLGLSGITQSTGIHPMQLHTPALPGIDEIELTGISLTDQPDSLPMEDSLLPPDIAMSPEPKDEDASSFLMEQRFSLDDLVDLSRELHTTPPGTPQTRPRHRSAVNQFGVHGRSISVPPSERMTGPAPPAPPPVPQSFSSLFLSSSSSSVTQDISRTANDIYDLPFLDLHYHYNTQGLDASDNMESQNQNQALDLAQIISQHPATPLTAKKNKISAHHRGQSAVVCPQDLVLKSETNKRKRSSWDGAHS
ncbi:uncharacterized protein EV420DRAFT_1622672 [Desarmillaria tabescens]|uniref:Myb-like domain-containing protein n=1 Tax=Armillaria tabescens TaxID=1929756 RepID=A0AA39JNM5_ARMTA|nr:uncharacterized protein EV420DRAFT_1622672 [Desarmillaria tabescens]KAK0445031.1 hypothetical protein EV420DRAFT_1622672 [Desarmillaria tabescens]